MLAHEALFAALSAQMSLVLFAVLLPLVWVLGGVMAVALANVLDAFALRLPAPAAPALRMSAPEPLRRAA